MAATEPNSVTIELRDIKVDNDADTATAVAAATATAQSPTSTASLSTTKIKIPGPEPTSEPASPVAGSPETASLYVSTKTMVVGNATPTITISNKLDSAPASDTVQELPEEASNHSNQISIVPALPPATSRRLLSDAAAAHGGEESTSLLQHEQSQSAMQLMQQQMQRIRTASSTLDASVSRNPSTVGRHEKKIGHRRVDGGGEVTYKKIQSKQIMGSIQLGIQHSVGSLASKPKRDLLMNDFWEMETIAFPPDGTKITPAHPYSEFRFKVYAPIAFRYFRDLFGIQPDDFLISMCTAPLRELSNPGASGSLFYLTDDDEFIIKTVQKKEGEFLQKLLPGYYMNLSQNKRTLLPKFFGLWCFHYNSKNVRLVAMNNLLPSDIKMHEKYDLKGSTFRRKASKGERQKASPTYKDLDFMERHPRGIYLEAETYKNLMTTIERDCMVLESFQIMDYSLLMGVHYVDIGQKEKRDEYLNMRTKLERAKLERHEAIREVEEPPPDMDQSTMAAGASGYSVASANLNRTRSMNRQRLVAHSTAMESITAHIDVPLEDDDEVPAGGIPARTENDERLILFIGIIDILQSYRLEKKLEHTFKAILYNGDTISVCHPSYYASRFQNFMGKTVFRKTPTFKQSPSKRKVSVAGARPPVRTPSRTQVPASRSAGLSRSSTPPPPFADISEEDLTANSSATTAGMNTNSASNPRRLSAQYSQAASTNRSRSRMSSTTEEFSDDDLASGSSGLRSPRRTRLSPRLSRTSVQVTTVGCVEEHMQEEETSLTPSTTPPKAHSPTPPVLSQIANDVVDTNGKPAALGESYKTTLVINEKSKC